MYSNKPYLEWLIPVGLWNRFILIEKKNKKEDNIYFGIGILILCTPCLMFLRKTSFFEALMFSVPLAILLPYLRNVFTTKYLKKSLKELSIKFYENKININKKDVELRNERKWVSKIKVIPNDEMNLLEFTINWQTSKGPTFDEFRIPILEDKKDDIHKIMNRIEIKS